MAALGLSLWASAAQRLEANFRGEPVYSSCMSLRTDLKEVRAAIGNNRKDDFWPQIFAAAEKKLELLKASAIARGQVNRELAAEAQRIADLKAIREEARARYLRRREEKRYENRDRAKNGGSHSKRTQ